jgi:hypothetical protein
MHIGHRRPDLKCSLEQRSAMRRRLPRQVARAVRDGCAPPTAATQSTRSLVYGSTWNLVDLSLRAVRNSVPVRVTLTDRPFLMPVMVMVETR